AWPTPTSGSRPPAGSETLIRSPRPAARSYWLRRPPPARPRPPPSAGLRRLPPDRLRSARTSPSMGAGHPWPARALSVDRGAGAGRPPPVLLAQEPSEAPGCRGPAADKDIEQE